MNTNTLSMTRKQDQTSSVHSISSAGPLDHQLFLGEWHNTNPAPSGMVRVLFADKEGELTMRVFGAGNPEPIDWGEVKVQAFADDVSLRQGTKFGAVYDFDFMQVRMHGWVKLGVLVFAVFNQFTDDSGRSNYFDREFFFAIDGA